MANTPWWDRKASKLIARNWQDVRDAWFAYIPTIDPPGRVPESSIAELPTLQEVAARVKENEPIDICDEIVGLRGGVFIEAVFLLHKAAHVLGCAQVDVAKGLRSWSMSNAYQSAFFSMKAITHFVGVVIAEVQNKSLLIDIWSPPQKRRKGAGLSYCVLLQNCNRFEHRQTWAVFQRMLRVTSFPESVLSKENITSLVELDDSDFARQRNSLHYRIAWPFDDLHQCSLDPAFGFYDETLINETALTDPDRDDFSIALGIVLLRMGYRMIFEIAETAPALNDELDVLRDWLRGDCHLLYQHACAIE